MPVNAPLSLPSSPQRHMFIVKGSTCIRWRPGCGLQHAPALPRVPHRVDRATAHCRCSCSEYAKDSPSGACRPGDRLARRSAHPGLQPEDRAPRAGTLTHTNASQTPIPSLSGIHHERGSVAVSKSDASRHAPEPSARAQRVEPIATRVPDRASIAHAAIRSPMCHRHRTPSLQCARSQGDALHTKRSFASTSCCSAPQRRDAPPGKPSIAPFTATRCRSFELALICDIRIAAATAVIGLPDTPSHSANQRMTYLLPRVIAWLAKYLAFTGRPSMRAGQRSACHSRVQPSELEQTRSPLPGRSRSTRRGPALREARIRSGVRRRPPHRTTYETRRAHVFHTQESSQPACVRNQKKRRGCHVVVIVASRTIEKPKMRRRSDCLDAATVPADVSP